MIGIYKITNNINGKMYIGQSWDIDQRFCKHKTNESNEHLRAAMEKYGIGNFSFDILRTFSNGPLTQVFLDLFEKRYIAELKTTDRDIGYNKKDGGSGGGKHSPESIVKMSEAMKGKYSGNNHPFYGKHHSEKSKKLMSEHSKGRKHTDEEREKMSIAMTGKKMPPKSPESLIKYRKTMEGRPNSMQGKHHSEETKKKISASCIGRVVSNETREKLSVINMGKPGYWTGKVRGPQSDETKNKRSESLKKSWAKRKGAL